MFDIVHSLKIPLISFQQRNHIEHLTKPGLFPWALADSSKFHYLLTTFTLINHPKPPIIKKKYQRKLKRPPESKKQKHKNQINILTKVHYFRTDGNTTNSSFTFALLLLLLFDAARPKVGQTSSVTVNFSANLKISSEYYNG